MEPPARRARATATDAVHDSPWTRPAKPRVVDGPSPGGAKDIRFWPPGEAGALLATRVLVAVFATLAAVIAFDPPGGIVAPTAFSGSLYAACFFPALIFGLYWKRGNGPAALASMVVGLVTVLAWRQFTPVAGGHEVFPALLLSVLSFVAVALARRTVPGPRVAALLDAARRA